MWHKAKRIVLNVSVNDKRVKINGKKIPPCPNDSKSVTIINDTVYIGDYMWDGKSWVIAKNRND